METCDNCLGTNIVKVTEIDIKGRKKKIIYCNDCGKEFVEGIKGSEGE